MKIEEWYPILKNMCHKAAHTWDIDDLLQDCAIFVLNHPAPLGITPQWLSVLAWHRYKSMWKNIQCRNLLAPTNCLDMYGDEGPPVTIPEPQENHVYLKEVLKVVQRELKEKAASFLELCQTENGGKGAPKGFKALSATERGQLFRMRSKVKKAMEVKV